MSDLTITADGALAARAFAQYELGDSSYASAILILAADPDPIAAVRHALRIDDAEFDELLRIVR